MPKSQAPWTDLELHTLGWKAFQDLCAHVLEDRLGCLVEIYREAQDGGQDAVFLHSPTKNSKLIESGTTQCKYFGRADAKLRVSHLTKELNSIQKLIKDGEANTYVFMTNAKVDAPIAASLKRRLRQMGVVKPHVLGREFLNLTIRSSSRLRALVPRIYGLGDLAQILDERKANQTKHLLGNMLPTLRVYLATGAHRRAVTSLIDHNLVLLLGNPATGKSSIAAVLSTIQMDRPDHRCFKVDSPEELVGCWNPNEPGGFYWIDDAFGPNNLRADFVDTWISIMPKISTAIAGGNQFVLTSRRHIYEAARPKLGARNHPRLIDQSAIVGVDNTTKDEQLQILYNHIKLSNQPTNFKRLFKYYSNDIMRENILPEISRRLANPAFTKNICFDASRLIKFIREPKQHLQEIIENLTQSEVAALTLVFLHRGRLVFGETDPDLRKSVLESFGQTQDAVSSALKSMKGSFLVELPSSNHKFWTYQHPTISDAIASYLMNMEGMASFYLQGAKHLAILSEVACVGAPATHADALLISEVDFPHLLARFADLEDTSAANVSLFSFLNDKASDKFLILFVTKYPSMLLRSHSSYWGSGKAYDSKIKLFTRLLKLGLLPEDIRSDVSRSLVNSVLYNMDTSFLFDPKILELIEPLELFELKDRIRHELLVQIPDRIQDMLTDADEDSDPENYFDDIERSLSTYERLVSDNDVDSVSELSDARAAIDDGKSALKTKAEQRSRIEYDFDWEEDSSDVSTIHQGEKVEEKPLVRNLFSDIDG